MAPASTPDTDETTKPAPSWHPAARVGFRFVFAYLGAYWLIPQVAWDAIVTTVGPSVFGVDVLVRPNGSGDTTYAYVQLACELGLAVLAAGVWTALDRRRPSYPRLGEWLIVACRYFLAVVMLSYGFAKVFTGQFPAPSLETLMRPYGDSSPMRLVWTFMGYSRAYGVFTGLAEIAGGLLLLSRRTTTLGALVVIGVMSNVVMLNFCFDVPVKIFSTQLLVLAVGLAALDARRLVDLLILQRPTQPEPIEAHFQKRGWFIASRVLKGLLICALLALHVGYGISNQREWGKHGPRSPLYGIYTVETMIEDGVERPGVLADGERWRHVIFEYPGMISVQHVDGSFVRYSVEVDADAGTMELWAYDKFGSQFEIFPKETSEPERNAWTIERPDEATMILRGALEGRALELTLAAHEPEFFLSERGFHWINEYPLNR